MSSKSALEASAAMAQTDVTGAVPIQPGQIITAMGGIPNGTKPGADQQYGLLNPGRIIHEVGTTRMGNDPKRSVVNKFNQAHDVKNLFVVDGGPFVSQADKNPTWTIMALSMRTSEYILDQLKKQNI